MKLNDMKASEALEVHLQLLVPTEPDVVWFYLRPLKARTKNFVEKLRAWAASAEWAADDPRPKPKRPGVRRAMLDLRTSYLDTLEAYEEACGFNPKFPHDIYTKKQIAKATALATASDSMHYEENTRLILDVLSAMPFRKSAGRTDVRIGGVYPTTATKALVYWCLREIS
jgi:hypothetical protein